MSGFDEEAERERLREKYERDQETRSATQRMSELLLKGATMTNKHCGVCGDPIFRHDGQEFCPTCQEEGRADPEGEVADAEADAEAAAESVDGATAEPEPTEPEATAEPAESTGTPATRPTADGTRRTTPGAGAGRGVETGRAHGLVEETGARERSTVDGRPGAAGDADALDEARASLSRTLVRYARAAEETDDPRRARDRLAAAREAAETLAALDRP